jgi:predicted membrane protein
MKTKDIKEFIAYLVFWALCTGFIVGIAYLVILTEQIITL